MTFFGRLIRAHRDCLWVSVIEFVFGMREILRNINNNRAGSSCRRNVKRLFDNAWDVLSPLNHEGVLHDWPRNPHHIGLLERILTDQVTLYLTRNNDHWYRVHVGRRNARNSIGCARP